MAKIPLKEIVFPGLDNTYTIPEIDNTLSTAGKAADAKKTGDEISELKEDLRALYPLIKVKELVLNRYGINRIGGGVLGYDNRLHSPLVSCKSGDIISAPNGYKYWIAYYSINGYRTNSYDEKGDWYREEATLEYDGQFSVVISKEDESDFTESECYDINNKIVLYSSNIQKVEGVPFGVGHIETSDNSYYSLHGNDYGYVDWSYQLNLNTARWRMEERTKFFKGATIEVSSGYRFYIFKYINGTVVNGNWLTEKYTFTEDTVARIVIDTTASTKTPYTEWPDLNDVITIVNDELIIAQQNEINDLKSKSSDAVLVDELIGLSEYNTFLSGSAGSSTAHKKNFTVSAFSDIHGASNQWSSFISLTNKYKNYLDCAMFLGDICGQNPNSDISFYKPSESEIPFLSVVGNHDSADYGSIGISQVDIYTRYIKPCVDAGFITTSKSYYYKDFSDYKIRVIALMEYEGAAATQNADSDHYRRYITTSQLQWFADTLYNTPSDYSVVVLLHQIVHTNPFIVDCKFTENTIYRQVANDFESGFGYQLNNMNGNPIGDIVQAFIEGTSINESYTTNMSSQSLTSIVDKDFSSRGIGKFICYLSGHTHASFVLKDGTYNNQIQILLPSASDSYYQRKADDIRPISGIPNFYYLAFDTTNKLIKMVKAGHRITMDMTERDFITIPY